MDLEKNIFTFSNNTFLLNVQFKSTLNSFAIVSRKWFHGIPWEHFWVTRTTFFLVEVHMQLPSTQSNKYCFSSKCSDWEIAWYWSCERYYFLKKKEPFQYKHIYIYIYIYIFSIKSLCKKLWPYFISWFGWRMSEKKACQLFLTSTPVALHPSRARMQKGV